MEPVYAFELVALLKWERKAYLKVNQAVQKGRLHARCMITECYACVSFRIGDHVDQ